eukprot:snap_masked-scaffold167_size293163-processed-gene-1.4 protein:Tk08577 transcript:snap_masked-scaffold167_size293163-processed-gene-1.4-mRNA-1 annotation:"hypothetical protein DAPPUDRAFT_64502"
MKTRGDRSSELVPLLSGDPTLPGKPKELIENYEQVLEHIGDFGLWQIILIVLLWLPPLAGGVVVLLSSFTALEPHAFRCRQPCDVLLGAQFRDLDIYEGPNPILGHCETPFYNGTVADQGCRVSDFNLEQIQGCQFRARDDLLVEAFEFDETVVTEWGLICRDQYKVALLGTAYMVGLFLGSFLSSTPADTWGRKPMIFILIAFGGFGDLIGGFVNNYWAYLAFRVLVGIGEMGMVMTTFTLSVELVGAKQQALVGNMNQLMFAVGECLMGVLAYYVRDWRYLHYITSAMIMPQLLLWWVIPESPRWLLAERKFEKLPRILKMAQKLNGKKLPDHLLIPSPENQVSVVLDFNESKHQPNLGFMDLFSRRVLVGRTLIMMVNWTMVAMVYYGIGMSVTILGGNIFLNFILSAVFEILGYIVCILITDHWGRKPVIIVNFVLCGLACVISAFVPDSSPAKIGLVLIGKMGSSGAFSTAYVYTAELFPTPIRGTAVGFSSMVGRIGSFAAPQLALFLPTLTYKELPLLIFGLAGLLGGGLSFFLPETLGHPLPDTLFEAAQQGKEGSTKKLWAWWNKSELEEAVEQQRKWNQAKTSGNLNQL